MDLSGKIAVVTGGANGIGAALARALHARGAKVAIADVDGAGAEALAAKVGGFGRAVDVGDEAALVWFLNAVERRLGPIDIFISNAGVGVSDGPRWGAADAPNGAWDLCWRVNVMASVYAARHLARDMAARSGSFVVTASAAGLLNQIGDAPYTATKHAALAFAESLTIAHGAEGLKVHCLCPQGVTTAMTEEIRDGVQGFDGYLEPEDVAEITLKAMEDGRFLILTHEATTKHLAHKTGDRDRWLEGMRQLRAMLIDTLGRPF